MIQPQRHRGTEKTKKREKEKKRRKDHQGGKKGGAMARVALRLRKPAALPKKD
jgi:hypothetical protein